MNDLKEKIADLLYLWDDRPSKDETHYNEADEILAYIKAGGYVKLADNQELPNPFMDMHLWRDYSPDMAYEKGQQDMLKAGFRKVEL